LQATPFKYAPHRSHNQLLALSAWGPTLCQFLHSSQVNQLLQVAGVATARKQEGLQGVPRTHAKLLLLLLLLLCWCQALELLQQVL
jgi:hypothetical protein